MEFQDHFCFDMEENHNHLICFSKSCISFAHNNKNHEIVNKIL